MLRPSAYSYYYINSLLLSHWETQGDLHRISSQSLILALTRLRPP